VSVICKNIEKNMNSPFYRFVCNDVCFGKLKYYKNKTGNPKTKKKYKNHFSKTAIGTRMIGDNPPKLPLPRKVKNDFDKFDFRENPGWVLGYHTIESLNFLYLFPSKSKRAVPSKVRIEDLPEITSDITEDEMLNFDFIANNIFIWPYTVLLSNDTTVKFASIFSIDRLFLNPQEGDIESISILFDKEELPPRLYFDLFYNTDFSFLYFKNKYEINLDVRSPSCIHFIPGCKWTQDEKLRISEKPKLSERVRRLSQKNWISG